MRLRNGGYLSTEVEGLRLAVQCYGVRNRERTSREAGKRMKLKPRRDSSGQPKIGSSQGMKGYMEKEWWSREGIQGRGGVGG